MMVILTLESIGRSVINAIEAIGRVVLLFLQTIKCLKQFNIKLTIKQMAYLGADSLPIVMLTILFTGMVITFQTAHEFIKYGAQFSVGGVVAIAMGRELAPILTGVVVAGRVGSAITAEIGSMKITEQIDALRVMATNPLAYLVLPRLIALIIMLPILVVFGDIIGTIGGYIVATTYAGIGSFTYLESIKTFTVMSDITGGLIKATIFGAIIAIIGCYKGLNTEKGAEGIGKATTSAVVTAIILIFMANFFMSYLLFR